MMSDSTAIDLALFLLRLGVGVVMLAHGIRHIFGGGKITGTAGWFGSMGMKMPMVQAWLASLTEIGAGVLLVLGLLTPFGGAGVVGVMAVAWIINHLKNGFFIFNKGEGYEYVMTLLLCGVALGTVGPGSWSLDDALDIVDDLSGSTGLLISLGAGGAGALLLLAAFWRPVKRP
jgi:putative oxidoreductase